MSEIVRHSEQDPTASRHELSGLPNRQALEGWLPAAVAAYPGNFSYVEIDLDSLKGVNDEYGHLEGDAYLKNFADVLSSILRRDDRLTYQLSGYGNDELPFHKAGDEFSVLLLGVNSVEKLDTIIQRIRDISDELGIPLSIGGHIHQPGETVRVVQASADRAMYADKVLKKKAKYIGKMAIIAYIKSITDEFDIDPRDLALLYDTI